MGYKDKQISEWSIQEVQAWLDAIGLKSLNNSIAANAVSGQDLVGLSAEDVMNYLGATPLQARKIRNEVEKLTGTASVISVPSQNLSGSFAVPASDSFMAAPLKAESSKSSLKSMGVDSNVVGSTNASYPDVAEQVQPQIQVVGAHDRNAACGYQMLMFILGWFFGIPWYIGAFGRACACTHYNPAEKGFWIANVVLSVIFTVFIIGVIVAVGTA